jgi:Smg protein
MDERIPSQNTFRVMGPHERGRFAPDAWGHLLSLNGSGAINGLELEHIIERALMQFEGRIALDDLRGLLEGTGLEDSSANGDNTTVH